MDCIDCALNTVQVPWPCQRLSVAVQATTRGRTWLTSRMPSSSATMRAASFQLSPVLWPCIAGGAMQWCGPEPQASVYGGDVCSPSNGGKFTRHAGAHLLKLLVQPKRNMADVPRYQVPVFGGQLGDSSAAFEPVCEGTPDIRRR